MNLLVKLRPDQLRPVLLVQTVLNHRIVMESKKEQVRFTEPVVICACEFLELHTASICPTLSLSGASFPQSFALEIFVRIGGEARFKRLCPAFLYSPSASSILEVQAAVTDHLVIRGSYRALSLVVYGNSVKELGQFNFDHEIDNTLSDAIIPPEAVFQPEDLPEALQDDVGLQSKAVHPLRNLHLNFKDREQAEAIHQLLSLALQITRFDSSCVAIRKVFETVLSAASVVLSEHGIDNMLAQLPTLPKSPYQSQGNVKNSILQARDQIQVIFTQWQNNVMMTRSPPALVEVPELLEGIFEWIQRSFQLSAHRESFVSMEELLIVGLASIQLICTDAHLCFQFVIAGGLDLLMSVLQYVSAESSAIALLILSALKCACQHAFACEAILGWWPANVLPVDSKHTSSFGYCSVLRTLLQTKRQNVSQLACQILHHLHAYQLASEFECEVEALLENASSCEWPVASEHSFKKLSSYLKGLAKSLSPQDFLQDCSPAQTAHRLMVDGDDNAFSLPPNTIFSWISASKFSLTSKDINKQILLILQERRFVPALAALLSAPWMRASTTKVSACFLELIGSLETLILALINSRSGLLFLASEQEEAAALISALMGARNNEERDFIDYRHAKSLMSSGFICQPQDVGNMLYTNLSVISVLDRLLGTTRHSESFLWLLWELSVFSRSDAGKQALSCIAYFPEVFVLLVEALQLESHSLTTNIREVRALNRAFIHSAAEVMQVILLDPVASSLAAWVPHALSLQKALQYCSPTTIDMAVGSQGLGSNSKDALCARLLDWVDAAVIFHKKGPIGLLRYVAALVVGSVTSVAVGGLPASDPVEMESTFGESAVSTELPSVSTLLGRGVTLGAAGTVLPDTALIQLTVSMRIMASISCHPGVAAVLFGEGAMSVLYILLEYGAGVLQSSTIDYDYMVEEDGEGDGITEMIMEQERELSLLGLLLPTLLLLLTLLKRLKVTHEEYRNTRLVEVLLQLHRCTCSRLASKISVLPQATGVNLFASVLRVIASILSFWPVCGWKPAVFTKLMGLNPLTLVQTNIPPVEPREAISVLWILGDMLPEEIPLLCTNKILAMTVPQSLAVATLLGKKSMKSVKWHCQPAEIEKLIEAMALQLDHISLMVSHLASTASTLLQGLLTKLIVRMACCNQDHGANLLRPVLLLVKEQVVSGMMTAENDIFRMEHYLRILTELARHPRTKKVLAQEGIVQILLQAAKDKSQSTKSEGRPWVVEQDPTSFRLPCLVLDIMVAICDPDISSSPKSPLNIRLAKEGPGFSEYCAIASWAYNFMLSLPLEKELDVAVAALSKLASHQLGRAAFATVAISIRKNQLEAQEETAPTDSMDADEITHQSVGLRSLVPFCRRLLAGLSESADVLLVLHILQHFALAAIQLSAAGRSVCGLGALHLLFEMDKKETKETLSSVMALLRSWVDSDVNVEESLDGKRLASVKALNYVTSMLRILDNLPPLVNLENKVKQVVDGLLSLQPMTEEGSICHADATGWRLLPQLLFEFDETETVWDPGCVPETDGIFDDTLKDTFTWECAGDMSDKLSTGLPGKRKAVNTLEAGIKKHGVDTGANGPLADVASSVSGGLTGRTGSLSSVAASSRRDTFRQRKPNTSRPPSMHVDDYVARERGNEMSTCLSGGISQRSALGGGRPPSIHVDEFMARQRDRHLVVGAPTTTEGQPPLVPQTQIQVETVKLETASMSAKVSRPIMPEEDLQDVDIEVGVPDTDDLMSLPSGSDFVPDSERSALLSANLGKASMEVHLSSTSVTVSIEPGRQNTAQDTFSAADDMKKLTLPQHGGPLSMRPMPYGDIGEANLARKNPMDSSSSASLNLEVQMQQGVEVAPTVGVSLRVQESGNTSFSTPVSHVGEQGSIFPNSTGGLNVVQQRNQLQFNAAPPLPPPLPPPPPIPAGVIPEKFEVSSGGSKLPPLLPSSASLLTTVTPPPPPLPRPSGSWQPADPNLGRIDQVHATPISTITYGMGPMGHQHIPQMGTAIGFSQAPLPPWPPLISEETGSVGSARVAPPLPPTPPPFSTSQQVPVVASGAILSAPGTFQIGRLPSESTPTYTSHPTVESPSMERKFSTFSPQIGQALHHPSVVLPTFQPPLPPGRPNISQVPPVSGTPILQHYHPAASQHSMHSIPTFQFSVQTPTAMPLPQSFLQPMHPTPPQQISNGSQQQEPGNLLQQILASPEAIQDLLKDQNKLQSLLEQHPKLISLLQEKMGQS
ncbi:hypothetical protein GOP47_0007032 [Adiantum capillus-veneris]|uniref:Virilizer N-terminal domain-containing protein n=1 Tax=Adiantum capillus-veneris TaxID=13818 RepID=A0A9D4V0T4_ADICA|nr:hypothetical protein GOP47_0007032 [Adiantum capillus-veneris]